MREKIQENISRIISNILETNYRLINEEEDLINDVGLDSMGFLELSIWIQREYQFIVSSEKWKEIKTVSELIDFIENIA
jgi:acyl carrier protein